MKKSIIILALAATWILTGTSCKKDDDPTNPGCTTCSPTDTYTQKDLLARPSIGIVFNSNPADKDAFNSSIPSTAAATFQSKFQARLLQLNPGYTTNMLNQTAAAFTTLLANDVLNVSTNGITAFFNGTQLLTGRTLAEDVIDTELKLTFGGPPPGNLNPGLISDNVNANDKPLPATFPYMASPH